MPYHVLSQLAPAKTVFSLLLGLGIGAIATSLVYCVYQQRQRKPLIDQYWLRTIYEHAELGMNLTDPQGYYLRVNQAYCRILGYTQAELLGGMRWQDITHPADLPEDQSLVEQSCLDPMPAFAMEKRCIRKDGAIVWVKLHVSQIYSPQGQLQYLTSIVEDISDRIQVQEALRASEARFRSLVQNSFDIIQVLDERFTIIYENPAIERILGYPPCMVDHQEALAKVHPDDMAQAQETMQIIMQQPGIPIRCEYRMQAANGSWIWLESIITNWLHVPEIQSIVTNARDITERKQVEEALRQSEATNWAIINSIPDHLVRLRRDGVYLDNIQDGNLKMIGAGKIVPGVTQIGEILPFAMAQERMAYIERAFATQVPQLYEYQIEIEGEVRYEEARIAICGENEVLVIVRDVTDLYRAEAALRSSEATNRAMLAAIPDLLFRINRDGIYLDVVQNLSTKLVRTIPVFPGSTVYQVLPHGIAQQRLETVQQALQTGKLQVYEQQIPIDGVLHDEEIRIIAINETEALVIVRDVSDRKQAERALQQQAALDRALNQVTQVIRNSLDAETIFATTVQECAKLLNATSAILFNYVPERQVWQHIASYSNVPISHDLQTLEISDLDNPIAAQLKQGAIVRIDDTNQLHDPANQAVAKVLSGPWLIMPICLKQVWGALSLVRTEPIWQDAEIELARAIVNQLAIAIQQSQLYQQVQELNAHLEQQVEERTAVLQKALIFEALLKRITDKVRDSLDENQILQAAVDELGAGLEVVCCNASLYAADQKSCKITHEYSIENTFGLGQTILFNLPVVREIIQQVLQGKYFQLCFPVGKFAPLQEEFYAVLVCPVLDDQGILGDLWLFKLKEDSFTDLEVRIVQQVANQCAIALRQSRLYQAAQAQVYELERLNQLKDDFLSTVSHELRTPMSNIKMATQMLEINLEQLGLVATGGDRINIYLQILRDECKRETNLINDLLDLSRLDSGVEPLMLQNLDLRYWLSHITEVFNERIHTCQQRLVLDLATELPEIKTDFAYLELVITELMHNACKYTPLGETIQVSANLVHPANLCPIAQLEPSTVAPSTVAPSTVAPSRLTEQSALSEQSALADQAAWLDMIQIKVANSGVEIPPEELSHVFDKFYRVPNNDPWKHGGTGLGLALVKKRVERLQGTISVTSADRWTTFTIQLPRSLNA
ncbi:MAG: PAS domain S-box protein [Leptolyngbyaceae cyanobacterium bins.349]|nr:PAS domain S-box protein [Leptolyngbyaceae cyanobacterium bins.349]